MALIAPPDRSDAVVAPPATERQPLTILYRGPLSSCNYECHYCPFAKRHETAAELQRDRQALARFVDWATRESQFQLSIFFTPWGEALVRPWYQEALLALSQLPHLRRVAIQTNLSCRLNWLVNCNREKLALWCTWHPTQLTLGAFLGCCRQLDERSIRYSVGVVGLREAFAQIQQLRERLSPQVYVWINAFKDVAGYYSPADVEFLETIDPLFRINHTQHVSLHEWCLAGESVITVDGEGDVRRCHFIPHTIGNLYDSEFSQALKRRRCTNATCGCYIGYVHMPRLAQPAIFGEGLLERIPQQPLWRDAVARESAMALARQLAETIQPSP